MDKSILGVISVFRFQSENNITIEFLNVTLLESNWKLYGINVNMYASNLGQTNLSICKVTEQKRTGIVNIINSTFGYLNVSDGFKISITDWIIDGSLKLKWPKPNKY